MANMKKRIDRWSTLDKMTLCITQPTNNETSKTELSPPSSMSPNNDSHHNQ